jgi:hypothetical protein
LSENAKSEPTQVEIATAAPALPEAVAESQHSKGWKLVVSEFFMEKNI